MVFGRDLTFLEEPYAATLDGLEGHDLAYVCLRIQLMTYFSMVVVGDWDQYVYLMNRDIEDVLKYFSRHSTLSLWFVPEADC